MIWSTHVIWIHWIQNKNWLFFGLLPIHTKALSFPKPINHCLPISIKATFRLSYVNVMRLVKLNPIHLIRLSLWSTFICLLSSFSHKLLSGSGGGDEGTPMKWSRGGLVDPYNIVFKKLHNMAKYLFKPSPSSPPIGNCSKVWMTILFLNSIDKSRAVFWKRTKKNR